MSGLPGRKETGDYGLCFVVMPNRNIKCASRTTAGGMPGQYWLTWNRRSSTRQLCQQLTVPQIGATQQIAAFHNRVALGTTGLVATIAMVQSLQALSVSWFVER